MTQFDEILDNTKDNPILERELMGIEITDDELLAMDPQLLVALQQHLKNYRNSHASAVNQEKTDPQISKANRQETPSLRVLSSWTLGDANFEEVERFEGGYLGTRIKQNNVTYIARRWKMTDEVKGILKTAADFGFDRFWRVNHPQNSYLEDNLNYLKGSHHIGCSPTHDSPWIFVLGAESLSRRLGSQVVKEITFNRVYHELMDAALESDGEPLRQTEEELKPGTYKIQKGGEKCYTVHPADFQRLIKYLSENITD
ncbi:MAG: hypothetical protein ACON31_01725 [Candidatus Puniceispirillaceae bacterium]